MNNKIEFPQPEVVAPRYNARYWIAYVDSSYTQTIWYDDEYDLAVLAAGNVYLSLEACEQRIAYNKQEMERLVIPAWFRALGPDVEFNFGGVWIKAQGSSDWSAAKPENYRSKPRCVVRKVGERTFQWPETVKPGTPRGIRYVVYAGNVFCHIDSDTHGKCTHLTKEGAETQQAANMAAIELLLRGDVVGQ